MIFGQSFGISSTSVAVYDSCNMKVKEDELSNVPLVEINLVNVMESLG